MKILNKIRKNQKLLKKFIDEHASLINLLFFSLIMGLFLYGVFDTFLLSNRIYSTDTTIYHYATKNFYNLKTYPLDVLYLPHFYYLFYPLSFLNVSITYIIICLINIILIINLFRFIDEIDPIFGLLSKCYLSYKAFKIGADANLDAALFCISCYMLYIITIRRKLYDNNNKNNNKNNIDKDKPIRKTSQDQIQIYQNLLRENDFKDEKKKIIHLLVKKEKM